MKILNPYFLEKGKSYFMESDKVKWYVTNNSEKGYKEPAGFCINVNSGYNSNRCYIESSAQFYRDSESVHAYDNMKDVQIRELTYDEGRWFSYCKDLNKFVPYDSVITKSSIIPLTEFPKSGVCWDPPQALRDFLAKKFDRYSKDNNSKGVAWSTISFWTVQNTSGQRVYTAEQLEPFYDPKKFKRVVAEDYFSSATEDPWYPLPEKWCIKINSANEESLQTFLKQHKEEYKFYHESWIPAAYSNAYFHYPQHTEKAYCTGRIEKGYTEITTKQFIKHVLTHTDNQQINKLNTQKDEQQERSSTSANSCKIQRFNISVRDTAPIRGIGLKCPKIQVKIGSGYLPD